MHKTLFCLAVFGILGSVSIAVAADPDTSKFKIVTIEVLIAELSAQSDAGDGADAASAEKLIAQVRELDKQGKLAGSTRVRLTTLENNIASAQFGERAPVVSGRTGIPSNRGGGGLAPGSMQAVYTMHDFGTILQFTPRVEPGGDILLEVKIDKTNLARDAKPAELKPTDAANPAPNLAAETFEPAHTDTLQVKSTLRVTNGQTVIVGGQRTTADKKSTQTVILLTAKAEPAANPRAAADPAPQQEIVVFHLQQVDASETAKLVGTLLGEKKFNVVADSRTNSLITRGNPEQIKTIEGLLKLLDSPVKPADRKEGPAAK